MISAVKSRLNHYGTLGVPTTASDDEIRGAFAKAMFAPHRMADAAQIGIAYEVLRNPAKRQAYDETLGLRPAEVPNSTLPSAVAFRISARVVGSPPEAEVTEQPAVSPQREPMPALDVGSFIARSLREPAQEMTPPPELAVEASSAEPFARHERAEDPGIARPGWNRTALTVGGLVFAVVLVGTWAGLEAGDASEADAANAVTATLPKAKPAIPDAAASPKAATPTPAPIAFAALRTRHRARTNSQAGSDRLAEVSQSLRHEHYETTAADGTKEIAVADAPASDPVPVETAAAATMPLASSTIARTLHRIGYGCGQVATTTAVEGDVYKVTCTSGQSYRAAPVRGRYHFKRWAD